MLIYFCALRGDFRIVPGINRPRFGIAINPAKSSLLRSESLNAGQPLKVWQMKEARQTGRGSASRCFPCVLSVSAGETFTARQALPGLLLRGKCPQYIGRIPPVTRKRHGQCGRHIQRKHSGIHLHRARIPVPDQRLNDLPGLAVIKHMYDIAVPESMGCHRN